MPRALAGLAASVTMVCAISACTSSSTPHPTGPPATGGTGASAASTSTASTSTGHAPTRSSSQIPEADLAAIRRAIDAINATAGGPVDAQRRELDRLAAPGQRAQQKACPSAHSTLAFQPAYDDLRPAPPDTEDTGASPGSAVTTDGSPSAPVTGGVDADGTAYLLPSFITIYTGERITGTDLTTLHLWVGGGRARTGALCVS